MPTLKVESRYPLLSRQIREAGLLDRCLRYYARKILVVAALYVAGWASLVLIGDSWWQLAVAVLLAFAFTQVGFLVHDAGHGQIFTSRRANSFIGVPLANLAIGLSYRWWVDEHNRHHIHPNQQGRDPGVEVGVLAFTAAYAHGRGRFARFAYRYQAYLFFPLLLLTAFGLHLHSIRHLCSPRRFAGRAKRRRIWESLLLTAHVTGYVGVVLSVLPPVKAVVFVLAQQGLFGLYVGCSIAPNHKGMPMLAIDDRMDFLSRQVLTSRNVRGGWLVDFVFGGLNRQIEHHLFPNMPQANLHRAQPIVREFCARHGLPYCETSLLDSYARALRHLHTVGSQC